MAYQPTTRRQNGEPLRRSRSTAAGSRRRRKKPQRRWWRTLLKVSLGCFLFFLLLGIGIFVVAYQATDIPDANKVATSQSSVIQYSNGKEMGRIASENRENVKLEQVPKHVRYAVLAAENRDFESEPGFSISGYMRAAWALIRGEQLQGGSTITQQLVKKTYLTDDRTFTRKFKELILAIKIERKLSKDEILERYLNTVYYGRGAYGIQTASKAYFDKDVRSVTVREAAVLASVIRNPSLYDPNQNPENLKNRYSYVLNGMESKGWLDSAAKYPAKPPKVAQSTTRNQYKGQNGYLIQMVKEELERRGISEDELLTGGYRVRTTFQPKRMKQAVKAVRQQFPNYLKKDGVDVGMASVDPRTGRVVAIYGGPNYLKEQLNHATTGGLTQPGSSFKPIVLASALKQGIGLRTTYDGNSPQTINGHEFSNSGGSSYGPVDIPKATQKSINTAYLQMGQEVGLENVAENAKQLGYETSEWCQPGQHGTHMKTVTSMPLGPMDICPLAQAGAIATFANQGTFIEPTTIESVRKPNGEPIDLGKPRERKVFSKGVAADTLHAMSRVAQSGGTAPGAALPDRPMAGKTGTSTQNRSAWFVGTVPQLTTTVATYRAEGGTIPGVQGEVQGGTVPASIWQDYMARATKNMPPRELPEPAYVGNVERRETVAPTPDETETSEPSETQTGEPSTSEPSQPTEEPTQPSSPPPTTEEPTETQCPPLDPSCNNGQGGGNTEESAREPDG
ncbi:MAG: penicillin-binding protein [Streptosporangiales bacterium]|nr:penicillin-binding protein [Streptosporangiales bacterium]